MIHRIGASEPFVTQALDPGNSRIPADKKSPDSLTTITVPFVVVNLAIYDLCLCKGEILGFLEQSRVKSQWNNYITVYEASLINEGCHSDEILQHSDGEEKTDEKKFITSPADMDAHHKVELEDADIEEQYKEQLNELCKKFRDIFPKDVYVKGKTKLVTMDIDTGDNSPKCQIPYNLPLKHAFLLQKRVGTQKKLG